MATIIELQATSAEGIRAFPLRSGRQGRAVRLPDGAIVETPPNPSLGDDLPSGEELLAINRAGDPATIHDANLGLIVTYLPRAGLFQLSTGGLAIVYGAVPRPLGLASAARRS